MAKEGGYECSFVKDLPTGYIQTECPICLHILREPHIVGCCGHRFCHACIQPIQRQQGNCPLCKSDDFDSLPDRFLERILKDELVHCSHKADGCDWEGKLMCLDEHIKACVWRSEIQCPYCNSTVPQHRPIDLHLKNCSLKCLTQAIADIGDLQDEIKRLKHEGMQLLNKKAQLERDNKLLSEKLGAKGQELELVQPAPGSSLTEYVSVTNLPDTVNESMLKSIFGQYGSAKGSVCSVYLNSYPDLAVIEYRSADDAKSALHHSKNFGVNLKSHRLCLNPVYGIKPDS